MNERCRPRVSSFTLHVGKRALIRVCSGCFSSSTAFTRVTKFASYGSRRTGVATQLSRFRRGVSCPCVPKFRAFLGSLGTRNIGYTIIADDGLPGVRRICGRRPRFGAGFSHILADRSFTGDGPSPSYCLGNTTYFKTGPRRYINLRSDFGKLGTIETSNTFALKLTAAGSTRDVRPCDSCIVTSCGKFKCSSLRGVMRAGV